MDWSSFFASITLCYFAPEHILAVIMFMMFDSTLDKKLTPSALKNMI